MNRRTDYFDLIVESFVPDRTSGHHGNVHLRPVAGQGIPTNTFVAGSKRMSNTDSYPEGTRFMVRACWSRKDPSTKPHLFSYHGDGFTEVSPNEVQTFLANMKQKSTPSPWNRRARKQLPRSRGTGARG